MPKRVWYFCLLFPLGLPQKKKKINNSFSMIGQKKTLYDPNAETSDKWAMSGSLFY